ncbi:hypothetical protein HDU96_006551 [Phlyctochytrium bullatum]|nr:hypothetical protein HDU96_006551 [Phlyctochytrium bullatum]
MSSFPIRILNACSNLLQFLNETARLTLLCLQNVKDDPAALLETGTVDAMELLLDAWATLALNSSEESFDESDLLPSLVKSHGLPIFQSFLQSKLILVERDTTLDDDEEFFDDRDDSIIYDDQLLYMGILGRLSPQPSLEHIFNLLGERVSHLEGYLKAGVDLDESTQQGLCSLNEIDGVASAL